MIEGCGSIGGGHNSHYLIQVTKQQPFKQWIFDITGPQHSLFDPCLDLPTYSTKYVDRFRLTAPLGTARILCENLADTKGMTGLEARVDRDAVSALEKGIREWEFRSGSNLPELLRQSEYVFKTQQQKLLTAVEESLTQFVFTANYTSEISSGIQDAIADFTSAQDEFRMVFSKNEDYLARFLD